MGKRKSKFGQGLLRTSLLLFTYDPVSSSYIYLYLSASIANQDLHTYLQKTSKVQIRKDDEILSTNILDHRKWKATSDPP